MAGSGTDLAGERERVVELTNVLGSEVRQAWGEERLAALLDRIPDLARAIALVESHSADTVRTDFLRPDDD